METYKQINLNDYVQTGEGGTSLTCTHKSRPAACPRCRHQAFTAIC